MADLPVIGLDIGWRQKKVFLMYPCWLQSQNSLWLHDPKARSPQPPGKVIGVLCGGISSRVEPEISCLEKFHSVGVYCPKITKHTKETNPHPWGTKHHGRMSAPESRLWEKNFGATRVLHGWGSDRKWGREGLRGITEDATMGNGVLILLRFPEKPIKCLPNLSSWSVEGYSYIHGLVLRIDVGALTLQHLLTEPAPVQHL